MSNLIIKINNSSIPYTIKYQVIEVKNNKKHGLVFGNDTVKNAINIFTYWINEKIKIKTQ